MKTYTERLAAIERMLRGAGWFEEANELADIVEKFSGNEISGYFEGDEWRWEFVGEESVEDTAMVSGLSSYETSVENIKRVTMIRFAEELTEEERERFEAKMVERRKELTESCPEPGCILKYNHWLRQGSRHRKEW